MYKGIARAYGRFLGNAKTDNVEEIVRKALDHDDLNIEPSFSTNILPSINDLARKYGNPEGHKIHFTKRSMRYRWLDLALEQYRKY